MTRFCLAIGVLSVCAVVCVTWVGHLGSSANAGLSSGPSPDASSERKETTGQQAAGGSETPEEGSGSGSDADSHDPGYGDLTMRFVYDGKAPPRKPLPITKDIGFCTPHKPLSEELVVDPDTNGIANVFVYLYVGLGEPPPEPHSSYAVSAKAEVLLDNTGCRFEPHACILRVGQTLVVRNSDDVGHNVKADFLENVPFNETMPATAMFVREHLTEPERLPAYVTCSIHPWMSARLLVTNTPYAAVSARDGSVTIKNLPVGKWRFQVWHETAGYVSEVSVGGKPDEWRRGRFERNIEFGRNDMGVIRLKPDVFAK